MATVKVTFTLDQPTLARLEDAAQRLAKPKSEVVRDAIHDYHGRIGRLSEGERLRLLRIFDELVPRVPLRRLAGVEQELRELRRSRRQGGRRTRERSAR
jgi:hypothetical protein